MNLGTIIFYVSFSAIAFLYTRECIRRHKLNKFLREPLNNLVDDEVFSLPCGNRDAGIRSVGSAGCRITFQCNRPDLN